MECMLTSDRKQLAAAIRPFRALHHLREAKILDVTTRLPVQYAAEVKAKFGTEIKQISLQRVVAAFNAVNDAAAQAETDRWIAGAVKVVEPYQGRGLQVLQAGPGVREAAGRRRRHRDDGRLLRHDVGQDDQAAGLSLPRILAAQQHGLGRHLRVRPAVGHDLHHLPRTGGAARLHQRSDHGRIDQQHHPGPLPGHAEDGGPDKPPAPTRSARSWSARKVLSRR